LAAINESSPSSSADGVAWDLNDLYSGVDDSKIESDLDSAEARADEFAIRYRDALGSLSAAELAEAVSALEEISELADAAVIFAQLLHAAKSDDPARGKLVAHVTERNSTIRNKLVFFELEWVALDDEVAANLIKDPAIQRYRHFLENQRRFKPHRLSEPEETLLEQKSNTGSRAFSRLFDELTGRLVCNVEIGGETRQLNESETLALLYDPDRDARRAAAEAMTVTLHEQSHLLTYVMNTLVQDHKVDDTLRSFASPMSSRNLANEIDQRSVDALIESCVSAYPTVHRFYDLKKRLLGYDELYDYDRYAPIAGATPECDWESCKVTVRDAYASFAPEAAEIVDKFFEGNWIDAELRAGKRGGAFSASGPTHAHPYILANYTDRLRDVMTIAHELGHGIHQYLARDMGYLQQNTPLTTAEMASVFGEMIVFHRLMDREDDPKVRLSLLTGKIEDAFATVFRQIVLCRFEQLVHQNRREAGELETDRINELWMQANRPMHGDTVTLTDNYSIWWSYIPHFIHVPFYTYAYAFGELLVLALYRLYQDQGPTFVPKYMEMLAKGGTASPSELVAPFGVDIDDPSFWNRGLSLLDEMVTQAVELARQ
jgi:oligoendopeptidase F